MKKFKFTLQKVLDVKNQLIEVKKNEMAQLHALENQINAKIDTCNIKIQENSRQMNELMAKGTDFKTIKALKNFFYSLMEQMEILKIQLNHLQVKIDAKKQELMAMKSEISGLEKLREKQRVLYNKQAQKEANLSVEEFVSHAQIISCNRNFN